MKRKQSTIIPAAIILITFLLSATFTIQPADAKPTNPVIVITQNAMTTLVNAGKGDLTLYETMEHIIRDGKLVSKSIVPAYFPTSLASNFSAISPQFNPGSKLAWNLTTLSKGCTLFFAASGLDHTPSNYGNKDIYAPTKTIEIYSLGVKLQITYNSTEEPIFRENQYSTLFGVIAIIDAASTTPPTTRPITTPTASPTVPEFPIITCLPLLAIIPILVYLRKNRMKIQR